MIITTCGLNIISFIFMYAFRMGLAISLVSEVPEKVWYHSNCPNRGKGCYNTTLLEQGGCAIWYNEKQVIQFFRIPLVEYGAFGRYSITIVSGGYSPIIIAHSSAPLHLLCSTWLKSRNTWGRQSLRLEGI